MLDSAYRGTRVLEIATGLSAGVAGRFFADLGAEVLRIELPTAAPERATEQALLDWTRLHKRTLRPANGKLPAAKDIQRLAADADLVITDVDPAHRRQVLPEPETLVASHPHLVVLDVTPFGRSGPYADYQSADLVELALSGYLYACGLNDREPVRIGIPGLVELISGVNAVGGAMIALRHARETGQGQVVEVSRLETMLGSGLTFAVWYPMTGCVRRRSPTRIVNVGALVPCADGYALLSTWRAPSDLIYLILHDERILEERFQNVVGRELHQDELYRIYCEALAKRAKAEVLRSGQELRMANAMVQTPLEVLDCPQHAARSFFQPFRTSQGKELLAPSLPILPPTARAKAAGARPRFVEAAAWEEPVPPIAATVPLTPRRRALDGLHVVELTFAWAGPFMGRILADYGAEVVKVESRSHPDSARGPDQVDLSFGETGRWLDRSLSYMIANTNKHNLGLELTEPVGKEVLFDLVRWADVLIENFTPRVLPNLGLGWEVFHEINPSLVMISSTGFGQDGPYRNYGAFGWGLEAMAGITYSDGYLNDPAPLFYQPTIPDTLSATLGITAVLAALEERRKTGAGQRIDLSQYEGASFAALSAIFSAEIEGKARPRLGNRHPWMAPQGVYPCAGPGGPWPSQGAKAQPFGWTREAPAAQPGERTKQASHTLNDQWVAIAVTSDEQWQRLCGGIGRPDLAADAALADHDGRWQAHERIDAAITAWTSGRAKHEAMAALQATGVPAGAVLNSKELQIDPQIRQLDYFRAAKATESGLRIYHGPWHRPQATPGEVVRGPSNFGEDNERVLREVLGYGEADVQRILASGTLSTEQEGVVKPPTPGLPVEVQLERGYIQSWDADYRRLPEEVAARRADKLKAVAG